MCYEWIRFIAEHLRVKQDKLLPQASEISFLRCQLIPHDIKDLHRQHSLSSSSHRWQGKKDRARTEQAFSDTLSACPAGFLPAVHSLAISSVKDVSVVNNWWWKFFPKICVVAFFIYMAFALWQWISEFNCSISFYFFECTVSFLLLSRSCVCYKKQ